MLDVSRLAFVSTVTSIYFHEDSYCMIELVPESAVAECDVEMGQAAAHSKEHWDGNGWTDIYLIDDHSKHGEALNLPVHWLAETVEPYLQAVDLVYTGYGSHRELATNVRAWARPDGAALFAEGNPDGLVRCVWLGERFFAEPEVQVWFHVVKALGSLGRFHIADWYWDVRIDCSDDARLLAYLVGELLPDGG